MITYKFLGIEEALYRLNLHKDKILKVFPRSRNEGELSGALNYNLISPEGLIPSHKMKSYSSLSKYIVESLDSSSVAFIGYNNGGLYSFSPSEALGIMYFGQTTLRKRSKGDKSPLPLIEFEDKTLCSNMTDYLNFFKLEDNYSNRGKVMSWLNLQRGEAIRLRKRTYKFDPNKVINLELSQNSYGKPVATLTYEGLPSIKGFSQLVQLFPKITQKEVEELYGEFGIPLPSTAKKFFRKN